MYDRLEVLTAKQGQVQFRDIAKACEKLEFKWSLEGSAGTLDTSYIESEGLDINEGDAIVVKLEGKTIFYGWVFSKSKSYNESVSIKAYDSKKYLAYKDVNVVGAETINECFERICKMCKLKYKVVDTSNYSIPYKIHDGETYNDMLQYAIDQTFIRNHERFCIRCNGDTLELVNVEKQQQNLIIGDKSLLTGYEYSSDIENTYTSYKIQRETSSEEQKNLNDVQKIAKRTTKTAQNFTNVQKWGNLHYYEKVDAKWTNAQIEDYMFHLDIVYGQPTKKLSLNCLGDMRAIPGNMVTLNIKDLEKEKVAQGTFFLITEATHTITHKDYTMDITVEMKRG